MFSLRPTTGVALALCFLALTLHPSRPRAAMLPDRRYTLEIHNHSEVDIYSIYMAPSYKRSWGKDFLGDDILNPDHYFTIENIIPGEYDFLIVDEDDRNCIRRDVLISRDDKLVITEEWLNRYCGR